VRGDGLRCRESPPRRLYVVRGDGCAGGAGIGGLTPRSGEHGGVLCSVGELPVLQTRPAAVAERKGTRRVSWGGRGSFERWPGGLQGALPEGVFWLLVASLSAPPEPLVRKQIFSGGRGGERRGEEVSVGPTQTLRWSSWRLAAHAGSAEGCLGRCL